ncbi:hypothetical protein EJB05_30994 [Eragrostis curvula]|uniref:KIB1-4 beta-propeller domain-containing protein n=1 Tax=Eragrostis curvula TaxID=38414 RepID=A0A5J9UD11_9POAL|nr:hypothetical protein EJB05_30994 [Eragrostis curvula]
MRAPALEVRCARPGPGRVSYLAVRRFRLCSPNQSPYLVYSSGDRDSNTATLHNLATNKPYHFSLPDPPFRSRYIVGSSQGWLVTADEQSNLHLLNPITGAQVSLPPAQSIKGVRLSLTNEGELHGHYIDYLDVQDRSTTDMDDFYPPAKTRHTLYQKVFLSSDPSGGDCIVLLKHGPWNHLSFVRTGDTKWTWLDTMDRCDRYDDVFYDSGDGLFYAVRCDAEIHTIDLKGPTPVVKVVLEASTAFGCPIHYILRAPWGDLLQISRIYAVGPPDSEDEEYIAYHQALEEMYLGPREPETDDEEECPPEGRLTVRRVELAQQKVTEITNLQGHVLFVGFNDTFMIHAREFPGLSPNHVLSEIIFGWLYEKGMEMDEDTGAKMLKRLRLLIKQENMERMDEVAGRWEKQAMERSAICANEWWLKHQSARPGVPIVSCSSSSGTLMSQMGKSDVSVSESTP